MISYNSDTRQQSAMNIVFFYHPFIKYKTRQMNEKNKLKATCDKIACSRKKSKQIGLNLVLTTTWSVHVQGSDTIMLIYFLQPHTLYCNSAFLSQLTSIIFFFQTTSLINSKSNYRKYGSLFIT